MTDLAKQDIVIRNDTELLWALDQYDAWSVQQAKGTDSGIANMLAFLREHAFVQKRPFRPALIERMMGEVREAEKAAYLLNRDLSLVIKYIADMMEHHPEQMDYDETLCYASRFLFEFDLRPWKGSKNEIAVAGSRHKYLQSLDNRTLFYMSHASGDFAKKTSELKELKTNAARPLLITSILKDYYNIPFYIGFHMQAFQEGAVLSQAVYDYLFSERSRGQLSSLLPPDGPIEVDHNRNDWVWKPENRKWIAEDWEKPITLDPRFRERMLS